MKIGKQFAALALCLAVLWVSRFAPYPCEMHRGLPVGSAGSWVAVLVSGMLLVIVLFPLAYDLLAVLLYRFGHDSNFDPIELYDGEFPAKGQPPISWKRKLRYVYPFHLVIVIFFLLPLWTKHAYCS